MSRFIDRDGRLFGRLNLVDAAVGAFVLMLVPLGYASYLLFRPPAPQITSVEPAQLTLIEERAAQGTRLAGKLKVRGTGLRPILRATIGTTEAVAFIFETPRSADVLFGEVRPGTHDLILYDGVHEVARAPGAVVIPNPPDDAALWLGIAGVLLDMEPEVAGSIKVGDTYEDNGQRQAEILKLGPLAPASAPIEDKIDAEIQGRQQRAALIAIRCEFAALQPRECASGARTVTAGATINIPGTAGRLRMLIDELVPVTPPVPATMEIRLYGASEVVGAVRPGDVDRPHLALDGRAATITAMGARHSGAAAVAVLVPKAPSVIAANPNTLAAVDVTATAGLDRGRAGWRYRGQEVRAGGPIVFTTAAYTLSGVVIALQVDQSARPEER